MTHLTRARNLPDKGKGETILIDAKQRAITNAKADKGVNGSDLRVCAEPSPDALSALAASSGLSISKQEVASLAGNFAIAEGAGSIGLRTQSIQLMRDAMYRLCEGYLSGAIDGSAFETLHRRFQSSMIAILAIEQLTGAVRPPAVVLGGNAIAGNAERAADLTEKTAAALQALRAAEKTQSTKDEALKTSTAARETLEKEESDLKMKPMPDEKDKARLDELKGLITKAKAVESEAKTAASDAKKTKDDKQMVYEALDAARQAALAGGGSAAVQVTVSNESDKDKEKSAAVAKAVQDIVHETLDLTFGKEFCATILTKETKIAFNPNTVSTCIAYLNETVEALKSNRMAIKSLTDEVANLIKATTDLTADPNADAEKLKAATKALETAVAVLGRTSTPSETEANTAGNGAAPAPGLIPTNLPPRPPPVAPR